MIKYTYKLSGDKTHETRALLKLNLENNLISIACVL